MQTMTNSVNSTSHLAELYYAVDVVVAKITNNLALKEVADPYLIILLYIFSVLVFFASVVIITG